MCGKSAILLLIVSTALIGGCGQHPAGPRAASSVSKGPSSENNIDAAICLSDPAGSTPVDAQVRAAQQQARNIPAKPDGWVETGRQWVRKARHATDEGFYLNARACAGQALAVDRESSEARNLRALALMNHHRFNEALADADDILRTNPQDWMALATRSDALLELGDFEKAAEAAQLLMDLKPDMASSARASYLHWLQGDVDGAEDLIREALEARDARDPEPAAWTFVQAGTIFWNRGDYEGADAVFAEALRWVPGYPAALVGRGRAALSLRRPAHAVEFLAEAYRRNPLPETAWLLGDAYTMQGEIESAQTMYDRVLREGRRSDKLTLALFLATRNEGPAEALRMIQEERRVRSNIYIEDAYAWALYRSGRIAEALDASARATRLGTRDARLLYHAGAIRIAGGDASGRRWIEEALRIHPEFDWIGAAEARRLLQTTAGA